ncbi:deoxyribonuclease-1-like [Saccoglossus kowalevskii]|uniref:Deoxyribonuclease n=1 Tax=Saccoglossus kowalevskii TaxID=10224 RepID=A0ABM0GTM9_SACKO|nr:PREDICTED: deoxyribonuclease-1-like 2-like [Saccoglossus kowalevskii]
MKIHIAFAILVLGAACVQASVYISAWNIQVFGKSKMSDPEVVQVIVDVIERYDICAVQEVRDIDEIAVYDLLDELNAQNNGAFSLELGPRVGRTSSKEQYAFYYRHDVVSVVRSYTYDDSKHDYFEREPHMVDFSTSHSALTRFVFGAIHVKPDDAVAEIDYLTLVNDDAVDVYNNVNVLIGGDYNADCDYVREDDWQYISYRTQSRFSWLIGDDADTNLASSSCAYDRLVTHGAGFTDAFRPGSAKVFYYDIDLYGTPMDPTLALDVSDHYPVEMIID